jgi:hypothetical protein
MRSYDAAAATTAAAAAAAREERQQTHQELGMGVNGCSQHQLGMGVTCGVMFRWWESMAAALPAKPSTCFISCIYAVLRVQEQHMQKQQQQQQL